jgi:prepilin-type N-terminal cleavage/methylation domain-containing protein
MYKQMTAQPEASAAGHLQKGFSLIELLVVVAIILIIAAIAIPNLIKSKIAANEASAVNSIRTINTGNVSYSSICPSVGYAATLADLGPGAGTCTGGANIIDPVLGVAAPTKAGYTFVYAPVGSSGLNSQYTLNVNPQVVGMSGQRYFYSDETGVIRYNMTAAASVTSPPLQ